MSTAGPTSGEGTMRAREPEVTGYVERTGSRPTTRSSATGSPRCSSSRPGRSSTRGVWKAQVADVGRRYRAVVFDSRGSGRSDWPVGPENYSDVEIIDDAVAVLDAVGAEKAVVVGVSFGLVRAADGRPVPGAGEAASSSPARSARSATSRTISRRCMTPTRATTSSTTTTGGRTTGVSSSSSSGLVFPEPHSTKQMEDATPGVERSAPRPS